VPTPKEWLDGIVTINKDGFPVFKRLPTAEEIARIKPTDLEGMNTLYRLQLYLGIKSPDELRQANVQYLARFNITKDSPLYAQRLNDLNNEINSNRVLVATSRRITEQTQTRTMLEGKDKQCVYVNEGDAPCDSCLFLNGEQQAYSWFVENNTRPGDQCLGGDNCLCILVPID